METQGTLILIPVPDAEKYVGSLRNKYDPSALLGIPAHITLLSPFKPARQITLSDIEILGKILKINQFNFSLMNVNTFPGVVILEPFEKELFEDLTMKIYKAFPDFPPFERKFLPSINPHLTIGNHLEDKFEKCLVEAKKIEKYLPINLIAEKVLLMDKIEGHWHVKEKFEFSKN